MPELRDVVIISAKRTPVGAFQGDLSSVSASQLGSIAIKAVLEETKVDLNSIDEVIMGNVLSANLGQAPATQAAKFAGLLDIPSTTINKVCASGTKAVMLAAQSIAMGINEVVVAGGMESMSNVPFYLDKARQGYKLGHQQATDGLIKDGLWDVYNDYHMGNAAELCASSCNISREDQDAFAIESYHRAQAAFEKGLFTEEIVSVEIPGRAGAVTIVAEDEEFKSVKFDKIPGLKPVFKKDGTVTAGNSSGINDGAAAMLLASEDAVVKYGLIPMAFLVLRRSQKGSNWPNNETYFSTMISRPKAKVSLAPFTIAVGPKSDNT